MNLIYVELENQEFIHIIVVLSSQLIKEVSEMKEKVIIIISQQNLSQESNSMDLKHSNFAEMTIFGYLLTEN